MIIAIRDQMGETTNQMAIRKAVVVSFATPRGDGIG
jgi:hypothetical protein